MAEWRAALLGTMLVIVQVRQGQSGCAEVDSMTEAVAGRSFLLGCISCKRRAEVPATATVDWYFKPVETEVFSHIIHYGYPEFNILHPDFEERLEWHGTQGTKDVQVGAIFIHNVTFNDTGTYRCVFKRTLFLPVDDVLVTVSKDVELDVVAEANRELTAVVAEIMMYILIVCLQLWMIGVLVYCYRKISAEAEAREARKALRAESK
uniref:Sodium channel regulatory subunit beta-3 n=2 Tax=Denticeps clupeoides TaxID=299321 RepID=A0AAY4AXN0_9TELE